MKKHGILAISILLLISSAAAPCPVVFTPPNSFVHLTDESQALLAYDDDTDTQHYIVRQAYEGVASDFGLVMPTPDRPNMTEKEEGLFEELHQMTKEPVENRVIDGFGNLQTSAEGVEVVESRDIGDFNATILKANSSTALVNWLDEHNFNYGNKSEENFQYYIEKDQQYYFTAMKINLEEADCLTKRQFEIGKNPTFRNQVMPEEDTATDRCWLRGGLQPIQFTYETDEPVLPLRIMSRPHDESPMTGGSDHGDHDHSHEDEALPPGNFLVYTLSDQPLTVPGAKVKYSDRVDELPDQADSLDSGKFLVRQRIKFNAHRIEDDLYMQEAKPFQVTKEQTRIVNPSEIDSENGLLKFDGPEEVQVQFEKSGFLSSFSYSAQKKLKNYGPQFYWIYMQLI